MREKQVLQRSGLKIITSAVILTVSCLLVLLMVPGVWKFLLVSIQIILILIIFVSLSCLRYINLEFFKTTILLDIGFFVISLSMYFSILFLNQTFISCVLSVIVVSFVPGYTVLRILDLKWQNSFLELIILSSQHFYHKIFQF